MHRPDAWTIAAPNPPDLQLHSIVHGVISLEHVAQDYGSERRRLRIVKMRGVKYRGGYHDFVIETGGVAVFPRIIAPEGDSEFSEQPHVVDGCYRDLGRNAGGRVVAGNRLCCSMDRRASARRARPSAAGLSALKRGESGLLPV